MDILFLLVPLAVVLAFLIGAAFAWSVRSGQFDDLEGPAHRILTDDDGCGPPAEDVAPPAGFARGQAPRLTLVNAVRASDP